MYMTANQVERYVRCNGMDAILGECKDYSAKYPIFAPSGRKGPLPEVPCCLLTCIPKGAQDIADWDLHIVNVFRSETKEYLDAKWAKWMACP
jgi:hypothetical protein